MTLPHPVPRVVGQPAGVPWPTATWPAAPATDEVLALVDRAFEDPALATTYAVCVVRAGHLVAERYGNELASFTGPATPVTADTPLLSWSMAKSVLHAAIGIAVGDGALDPDGPLHAPEWPVGDARRAITVRQALAMRDGLEFAEDYVDDTVSDVIEMLFGAGARDVAAYAAARPLAAAPGTRFSYSSGTSNLLARTLGHAVGGRDGVEALLHDRLFTPIGMTDATVHFDDAGTFIGSSFVYATARSWARFATLYLRGGTWDGAQVVPRDWSLDAQRVTAADDEAATFYSHHWWCDGTGSYWASGYRGQRARLVPDADAVVVRLGDTPAARYAELRAWADALCSALR